MTNKALQNGKYDTIDGRIRSCNYFDLSMSQVVYERYAIRFGVNKLFDKDPPLVDTLTFPVASTLSNANTYPSIYDTLGRVFFLNLVANF
jgi:iron complex outermembrane recepter protein